MTTGFNYICYIFPDLSAKWKTAPDTSSTVGYCWPGKVKIVVYKFYWPSFFFGMAGLGLLDPLLTLVFIVGLPIAIKKIAFGL